MASRFLDTDFTSFILLIRSLAETSQFWIDTP
jgi:hypothetical protein